MSPKILFVTYGAGHAAIVARVVPALRDDGRFRFGVLGLTTSGPQLQSAGIPFNRCTDYLPIQGYEDALEMGAELSAALWHASTGIPYEESCAYLGVSMVDLRDTVGADEAKKLYDRRGRKAFCPVRFLGHVLQREAPDVVVTTCHVRMERAAVMAARRMGIKTVLIEDLFGYTTLGEATFDSGIPVIPASELHDHVLVLNGWVRDHLIRAGLPGEKIEVTGQPVFSDWNRELEATRLSGRCRELKADPRPVVTYATPARRDILYEQSRQFCNLARSRPDLIFVIKLHPSVPLAEFEQHIALESGNLHVLSGIDIKDVMLASDVMVVFRSTVGLLALFSGKPLVVIDCTGDRQFIPYVREKAAVGVSDYQNLEAAINQSLLQRERPQLSPVFENTSDATKRILRFLARLTGAGLPDPLAEAA